MKNLERNFLNAMAKHLDSLSFQPHMVGGELFHLPDYMQERLAEVIVYIIGAWSDGYQCGSTLHPANVTEMANYMFAGFNIWEIEGQHRGGVMVGRDALRALNY